MILFIVTVFIVGLFAGVFVAHKNFVLPAQESEAKMREELRETRRELWKKSLDGSQPWTPHNESSVAHFDLTEPKVERREHSDVFFIQVEDLLR